MGTIHIGEKLTSDQPHPPQFLTGKFYRARQRTNQSKAGKDNDIGIKGFKTPDVDLMPKRKEPTEVSPASGSTEMYQLGGGGGPGAAPIADPQTGQETIKFGPEPPDGGEVEVGTMAKFLMDPSENPAELQEDSARYHTQSGRQLDIKTGNGALFENSGKQPDIETENGAPFEKSGLELVANETIRPVEFIGQEEPVSYEQAGLFTIEEPPPDDRARSRWMFLFKWVLPQCLLLLVIVSGGLALMRGQIDLDGKYEAIFSDHEGRQVSCQTLFQQNLEDAQKLQGKFACKLYPNEYSTKRADEPRVLKPIMANGVIPYVGKYERGSINLILGSLDEGDTRSVLVEATISPNGRHIMGRASNSLGQRGSVEMFLISPERED